MDPAHDCALTPRHAVLIDPAQTCLGALSHPLLKQWHIIRTDSWAAATDQLKQRAPAIGLVVFDDTNLLSAEEFETHLWREDIEWLALISPGALSSPGLRDLVCRAFFDHHTLPIDPQRLALTLGHAWGRMMLAAAPRPPSDDGLIGQSPPMQALRQKIERVARADANVLISGETGSGKERVARAIVARSARAAQPFVAVNCATLSPNLIQSELFGHEKGAFTGATARHIGRIEAAHRGTLLLDEIGDLPLPLQAHLLRFLEEHSITRLGAHEPTPVDVRVLAASHLDLAEAVKHHAFREDLFHRLNALVLQVPPLRERGDDVLLLAESLLADYRQTRPTLARGFSRAAKSALLAHDWPGNVRELANRIHRAAVMGESKMISPEALGLPATGARPPANLRRAHENMTRDAIESHLRKNGHNMTRTAQSMGIARATLYRMMRRLDIHR